MLVGLFLWGGVSHYLAAAPLSIEGVCAEYPERVQSLFSALDLERPELAPVRDAANRAAWPEACAALLAYYRDCDSGSWLRGPLPETGAGTVASVEAMLHDSFTFYGLTDTVPRLDSGGLNWSAGMRPSR